MLKEEVLSVHTITAYKDLRYSCTHS